MRTGQPKHEAPLPSLRSIRRACGVELYRTVKRLRQYVPAELVKQAEEQYVKKVVANLLWIHENRSDRKKLADWWEKEVCGEIAELWSVDSDSLASAFRSAFGG
ncbi:dehydrogenase [Cohnella zeiphila]|uniref:Dehydrogenase n=1 Tax=Cohnella zeiphila TaxID=2761120 RepID=A0A7X0SL10_9BACL|nr:dehydrogenase [Cohnella zeiphila]MBB6731942.1 dehydrogenase [Cohnella zeiphila]